MAHDMSNLELRSIRIEPASNGYTVECNYKMKSDTKRPEPYDYDNEHEQAVFNDKKAVLKFVGEKLS